MHGDIPRYSRLMIAIHWLTAVLVVIAYLVSEGSRSVRTHPEVLHFACGFAVLVLVLARLIARAVGGVPPATDAGGPWLRRAAKLGHATLYVLLLAVPLTGWYAVSRLGVPIDLYGLHVPAIAAAVKGRIGPIGQIHQVAGNVILILAGAHAAMGLWHQFVRRDHTLERMRPF
ncbi:MAG TPA: cytochrome b [Steroidobacteraceae bacterium]|nr:cytochrome b [Steroidobacteraceae bacterium]